MSEPCQQVGFNFNAAAAGIGKALRSVKALNVRQSAVFVFLQSYAASACHCRHFFDRENQQFAVIADDGKTVAGNFDAENGLFAVTQIHNLAAVAGLGNDVVFVNHEAFAGIGGNDIRGFRLKDKSLTNLIVVSQVNHQTQRLAEPAAAGNFGSLNRKELS